jgi:hypothetical protein
VHSNKKLRRRRSSTAEIVELYWRGDRTGLPGQVARDFDLTRTTAHEWIKQEGVKAPAQVLAHGGPSGGVDQEGCQVRRIGLGTAVTGWLPCLPDR